MIEPSRLKRAINVMPADIEERLQREAVMDFYRKRPPYQQNDYLGWIARAKRLETREKRVMQMIEELRGGDRYMGMSYHVRSRLD